MDNRPKISVLTAVYNAERFLRPCLDSLMNQTLADCQFICIDDCSTDGSFLILKEYVEKDKRFHLLRTPVNSGQAKARNLGLQFAQGDCVAMLDADDWLSPDALEKAYEVLLQDGVGCAVFQLVMCDEKSGKEKLFPISSNKTEWSGEEAFRLSLDWSLHGLYVVKADIHKRFPFDDSCRLYSDDNTTRLHYLYAGRVVLCQGRYYYRKYATSMTNACSILRFDYMRANLSMKHQLESLPLADKQVILDFYEEHRWLNIVGCYWYYDQHRKCFTLKERQEIRAIFVGILSTVEAWRIPWRLKMKLGYYPFKSYWMFSRAERMYFSLRWLWYKVCGKSIAST